MILYPEHTGGIIKQCIIRKYAKLTSFGILKIKPGKHKFNLHALLYNQLVSVFRVNTNTVIRLFFVFWISCNNHRHLLFKCS